MKLLLFFLFISCAKLSYLVEQGVGQFKLQWNGKKIEQVLSDPEVKYQVKNKLKLIKNYKEFFYKYFDKEKTSIYSKVTFLNSEAVTHLVIASSYDKVEPLKTSFPFFGSFPYLGFFSENSAEKYQKRLEAKDFFTYKRPVYAYSTLGKLEDRILSSFFKYSDEDLAELIFHELFHTVFFIKSNVDLNENLANYFGKELTKEYFKNSEDKIKKREQNLLKHKKLRRELVELIQSFKEILKKKKPRNKSESEVLLKDYLEISFFPSMKQTCQVLFIEAKKCYPLKMKWNHASFAAFMTYEKKVNFISKLREKYKVKSLKKFLTFFESEFEKYEASEKEKSFEVYLERLL